MDGFDCSGHLGEEDIGNWVLLAKAGKKLPVPFIASGGVGTGTQLAAALAMGACGVNMSTRFMATKEAPIHQNIKQALVDGQEGDTTLVMRTLRNTERVYKNKTSLKVVETEKEFPGDTQSSVWSCGQVMGLIEDVPSCDVLLKRMVQEAEECLLAKSAMVSKL